MTSAAASAGEQLEAPQFYCPIDLRAHRGADQFTEGAVTWAIWIELEPDRVQRERLAQCDFGGLTAKTMPYGQSGPLQAVARMHAVLFSLDDGLCDEADTTPGQLARETSRIMRVLEAPHSLRPDDSGYARALKEVRAGLEAYMTDRQMQRWIAGMRIYLSGLVCEAAYRRGPVLPGADDYLTMWMAAIGMAPFTTLLDVVAGREVSDQELDRPQIRALTEMTWALVAFDNDLYSRSKEITRASDHLNIVDVLAHEHGYDLASAQDEALRIRDAIMQRFLQLGDDLIPHASPALGCYLTSLRQFVRGHLDWAFSSPRYADDRDRIRPRASWWKSAPAVSSPHGFGLPSIAWWWLV